MAEPSVIALGSKRNIKLETVERQWILKQELTRVTCRQHTALLHQRRTTQKRGPRNIPNEWQVYNLCAHNTWEQRALGTGPRNQSHCCHWNTSREPLAGGMSRLEENRAEGLVRRSDKLLTNSARGSGVYVGGWVCGCWEVGGCLQSAYHQPYTPQLFFYDSEHWNLSLPHTHTLSYNFQC